MGNFSGKFSANPIGQPIKQSFIGSNRAICTRIHLGKDGENLGNFSATLWVATSHPLGCTSRLVDKHKQQEATLWVASVLANSNPLGCTSRLVDKHWPKTSRNSLKPNWSANKTEFYWGFQYKSYQKPSWKRWGKSGEFLREILSNSKSCNTEKHCNPKGCCHCWPRCSVTLQG